MEADTTPTESRQPRSPRARVILEFIEADLTRPPIVYAVGNGSDEQDEAMRQEILKKWDRVGG